MTAKKKAQPSPRTRTQQLADSVILTVVARVVTVLGPLAFAGVAWWIWTSIADLQRTEGDTNSKVVTLAQHVEDKNSAEEGVISDVKKQIDALWQALGKTFGNKETKP